MPSGPMVVTGAAGFIGSHLCDRLVADGHHVIGVDNFTSPDPNYGAPEKERNLAGVLGHANFELHRLDVTATGSLVRLFHATAPRRVIHLAAHAGVRPSLRAPDLYLHTNAAGTLSVLRAMAQEGIRDLTFASSSSVYGRAPTPFREDARLDTPASPYAASKIAAEALCQTYAHLHDFRVQSLRFFTVYGPRQRPDLAIRKFMARIEAGTAIPRFGDGSSARDYTYVDDIVEGIVGSMGLQDPEPWRAYNLGNRTPVTLSELIEAISACVAKPAKIEAHPEQPGDVAITCADIDRAAAAWGYRPQTKLRDGLASMRDWLAAQTG